MSGRPKLPMIQLNVTLFKLLLSDCLPQCHLIGSQITKEATISSPVGRWERSRWGVMWLSAERFLFVSISSSTESPGFIPCLSIYLKERCQGVTDERDILYFLLVMSSQPTHTPNVLFISSAIPFCHFECPWVTVEKKVIFVPQANTHREIYKQAFEQCFALRYG